MHQYFLSGVLENESDDESDKLEELSSAILIANTLYKPTDQSFDVENSQETVPQIRKPHNWKVLSLY